MSNPEDQRLEDCQNCDMSQYQLESEREHTNSIEQTNSTELKKKTNRRWDSNLNTTSNLYIVSIL